jgi:hypothetical protein
MTEQDRGEPVYLTGDEVAARYRTARETVRYWRKTGFGPKGKKVGRRVLYPMSEIERFDRWIAGQAADYPEPAV